MTEQYPAQETRLTPPPTAEQLLAAGSELLEHFGVQG